MGKPRRSTSINSRAKELEVNAAKISIACDKCGKKFGVDAALAGRAVKCPCGNVLKVAAGSPAVQAAPAATAAAPKASAGVASPGAQSGGTKPAPRPQSAANAAAPKAAAPKAAAPVVQNNLLDQLTEADFNRKAVNPYSPPASMSTSDAAALKRFGVVDEEVHAAAKAATGNITFLAVLNFIGAAGYLVAGVLLLALTSILGTVADVLPIAALGALAAGVLFFFGVFDLVSGIGLLKRTKWGWWFCVLGLSWAFFDRGFGVAIRFMYTADWTAEIPKAIGGVVFMLSSFYFLQFMCQRSTMKLFKLSTSAGLIWAIAISFGLLFGGLGFGAAIYGMRQAASGV